MEEKLERGCGSVGKTEFNFELRKSQCLYGK